jgi:hypothetical protein
MTGRAAAHLPGPSHTREIPASHRPAQDFHSFAQPRRRGAKPIPEDGDPPPTSAISDEVETVTFPPSLALRQSSGGDGNCSDKRPGGRAAACGPGLTAVLRSLHCGILSTRESLARARGPLRTKGSTSRWSIPRLWARVQVQLGARATPSKGARRMEHPDFPLRGHVRCKGCGRALTASKSRGKMGTLYLPLLSVLGEAVRPSERAGRKTGRAFRRAAAPGATEPEDGAACGAVAQGGLGRAAESQ